MEHQRAEASVIGDDIMVISSGAGRAAIHEELIHIKPSATPNCPLNGSSFMHIKQVRYYGAPSSDKDVFLREIEAGKLLLKNATKWNLTHKEIEDTKLLIKKYTNDLNELKGDIDESDRCFLFGK